VKSNRELRQQAWGILRSQWFWRLLTVGLVLNAIAQTASWILSRMFVRYGIQTWNDFWLAKTKAMKAGVDFAVPSLQVACQMTGATFCQTFVAYIFAAILAYGFAGAALKSVGNNGERWFADSFDGFRRPLELAWLMFVMNFRVMLWSLLLFFPGLIAVYRYRQAWYLKNEHPDWSAGQCLSESGRMMRGYKWKAFSFDMSYCWWWLLVMVMLGIGLAFGSAGGGSMLMIGTLVGGLGMMAMLYVLCYFFIGRAVFYRELIDSTTP